MARQANRLDNGGRIDRGKPLTFTFDGRRLQGYAGDTLASALLANGIHLVGRSFKYHRPRGIYSAGAEEPNAIVQIGRGATTSPDHRATQVELYDGLEARSLNAWPSLNFDIGTINQRFARFLPAGFYYKTFMWPGFLWPTYEKIIRAAAGMGETPTEPDPDRYDKRHGHCDVMVVGSGPAGVAAALAAARGGARVMLVDEQGEMGGSLLADTVEIDGKPAAEWLAAGLAELAALPEVTLLPRTTAFGYYDCNTVGMLERVTDHLGAAAPDNLPRQRLWTVRVGQVVLATGAIERSMAFSHNDRPGTMLAGAVRTYIQRFGVLPGRRAVVFTNNDSAYGAAIDLAKAGAEVAAIVDLRPEPAGPLAKQAGEMGLPIFGGHSITKTSGGRRIRGVEVMTLNQAGDGVVGAAQRFACDLLCVSGGWNPAVHLFSQSGGRNRFDTGIASFRPDTSPQDLAIVGAANGDFTLAAALADGHAAGLSAARAVGFEAEDQAAPITESVAADEARTIWMLPSQDGPAHGRKHFVDLQGDVTAGDIQLAAREGYRSVEHTKRYTTLGMGTDQGKTGNITGHAILAETLDSPIEEVGTSTFRPPYTPVTFGALAGRDLGPELADPTRRTPMHHWHEANGAKWEDVGQWKRPWYYPKGGEDMRAAVDRECLAVRNGIGILDATTLGKIDIQGPDAATLLNRIYTNAWSKLAIGRCRYGLMLGEDGMVIDDGVTARLGENHFLMTTTTGNAARILGWLEEWVQTEWPELKVYMTSVTEQYATATICGPKARQVLTSLSPDTDLSPEALPFMGWCTATVAGLPARIFRVSFTGESSFEINVPANHGMALWSALMAAGAEYDITPFGTETMHVLRAEKGFIIVGQETDGTVTPADLGMAWALSKTKDFIGKRSLSRPDSVRDDRKQLVGLLPENPNQVLPEGAQLLAEVTKKPPMPMIGHVTSSYFSATLGRSFALALLQRGASRHGEVIDVGFDGQTAKAKVTEPCFYDPEGKRLHD